MAKRKALTSSQIQLIAKALADPRRFEMLQQIGSKSSGVSCSTMRECHAVSAATLSHHMKELARAGLVRITREGKFAHMELEREVLDAYVDHLKKI